MPRISRKKRTNKMKKEVLKGCLIAVLIGATGTVGSFAYFTSHANVKSNLTITTGSIDIGFNKQNNLININGLLPSGTSSVSGVSGRSEFKIKNTGSLNQKAEIYFSDVKTKIPSYILNDIHYEIFFKDKDNKRISIIQKGNLQKLMSGKKIIIYDKKLKQMVLKKDEQITCSFQVMLTDSLKNLDDKYSNESIKFKVGAKAVQTNDINGLK